MCLIILRLTLKWHVKCFIILIFRFFKGLENGNVFLCVIIYLEKVRIRFIFIIVDDALSLDYNMIIKISRSKYFIALDAFHTLSSINYFLAGLQKFKFTDRYLNLFLIFKLSFVFSLQHERVLLFLNFFCLRLLCTFVRMEILFELRKIQSRFRATYFLLLLLLHVVDCLLEVSTVDQSANVLHPNGRMLLYLLHFSLMQIQLFFKLSFELYELRLQIGYLPILLLIIICNNLKIRLLLNKFSIVKIFIILVLLYGLLLLLNGLLLTLYLSV